MLSKNMKGQYISSYIWYESFFSIMVIKSAELEGQPILQRHLLPTPLTVYKNIGGHSHECTKKNSSATP